MVALAAQQRRVTVVAAGRVWWRWRVRDAGVLRQAARLDGCQRGRRRQGRDGGNSGNGSAPGTGSSGGSGSSGRLVIWDLDLDGSGHPEDAGAAGEPQRAPEGATEAQGTLHRANLSNGKQNRVVVKPVKDTRRRTAAGAVTQPSR